MNITNTSPNGARAKIMRALITDGMLTTAELATNTGLRPDQARDNAVQARKDGLVTSERDDVTGLIAYKITAKGRELCANKEPALPKEAATEPTVDAAAKEPEGPTKCDCASTMHALYLAQKEMARQRDDAVRLSVERDDAILVVNNLREMLATMDEDRNRLRSEIVDRDSFAQESDAIINERLSKYDAVVGERSKLAVDVANLQADNDKLRRRILALESRAPSLMVTEYVGKSDNSYIELSGSSREEAVEGAADVAGRKGESVRVYGMVLIGTVEIRPVFVEYES